MPVEVGVGYVSIVPEMRRFASELDRQMSRHSGSVQAAVADPMADAGAAAGDQAGQGVVGGIRGKVKGGMLAVGALAGALLVKGVTDAMAQEKAGDKLAAQLGLSEKESARLGKVSGSVYAKGYGESVEQVNDSLRQLAQNGVVAVNAPKKDLAGLSKAALNLAETFDADVGGSARAAGQLIKTGLAKDGKEAFDLITRGFQSGADKSEDLLDTLNEYSTQFRDLGLTGSQALGLLTQGLKAGARDSDTVADALKEFAIRAKDGSDTTKEGFKAIQLSASEMAQTFAKGGPEAGKALDKVLDKIRAIEDPAKRSEVAIALFGTKAEDLQQSLFALDPSKATDALGKVGGAADRMGDTLHDNASTRIETFKRTLEQGLVNAVGGYVLPALSRVSGFLNRTFGPAWKTATGAVSRLFGAARGSGALAPLSSSLEKVGAGARSAFGPAFQKLGEVTRTTLLPALGRLGKLFREDLGPALSKYFGAAAQTTFGWMSKLGSILVGTVWPAAVKVYSGLASGLGPVFRTLSDLIRERVVPGVQMIGEKLSTLFEKAQPVLAVIGKVAGFLGMLAGKVIGFVVPILLRLAGPVVSFIFNQFGRVIDIVSGVIGAVVSFGRWVGSVASAVGSAFMWLYNSVIKPVWNGIRSAISFAWGIIQPIFEVAVAVVRKSLGIAFQWLYNNVIKPVWSGIRTAISFAWNSVIKPVFDRLSGFVRDTLGPVFGWLRDKVIRPVWDTIRSKISTVWREGIKPIFDRLKGAVGTIGDSFETAKKAVKKAWDGIKDATKKPVNFVLGTVWNDGLLKAWNSIAGWVGLDEHKLKKVKLLERGGTVGTEPGIYNRPTAIVGEGRSQYPEYVIPTDPRYRQRALSLHAAAGTQLLEEGGVIGRVTGVLKKVGGAVLGGIRTAADFLSDPSAAMRRIFNSVLEPLKTIGGGKWGKAIAQVPRMAVGGIKTMVMDWFRDTGGGDGAIGGSIPSGRRRAILMQALAAAGVPPPGVLAQWLAGLNTLITRESGWNPRAINNWDINAKNGVPSQGLAQTIPPTWSAYVPNSLRARGILDPVSNVAAAIRYIVARYGNITRVQQANANAAPKGYASGGRPRPGEVAWVGERGPELLRFGGGQTIYDHRTSLRMARREAEQLGAAVVTGMVGVLPRVATEALARGGAPVPVGGQRPPVDEGALRRGDTLILRVGEREFEAVVDERVDAGLSAVRQRSRAGARRG
ncbi:phage tail tape measure protein [Streptomyces pini]|uniref:Phage-related minor tail protein n=1 Tax=Streptomyces pini TaxID=1520580 RepID=A0A1I4BVT3_9ACTN|nr:phage tail tape measure protein [Streptomyces pini]SFK72918.1 Phage-related minor tail protein [Streptomyces pini]